MWVNPFWLGVGVTIVVEIIAFVVLILYIGFKHDDKE